MREHGLEYGREYAPSHRPPQGFPHHEFEYGYRGYRLPPTKEEELEILEKWKTKMEEAKTKMDKKLARIDQRIEKLKKEA
jgi:hypothetical protein